MICHFFSVPCKMIGAAATRRSDSVGAGRAVYSRALFESSISHHHLQTYSPAPSIWSFACWSPLIGGWTLFGGRRQRRFPAMRTAPVRQAV